MTKEELIENFTEAVNQLPDNEITYCSLYADLKTTDYRGYETSHNIDNSFRVYSKAPFICDMAYSACEERGYCNGDC